jgi:hypothetical protein
MKNYLGVLVLIFVLSVAAFAGDQDFVLVNQTGLTIDQFFCSPTKSNDWEEDVLGQDTLADNSEVEIKFSRDEASCKWDLMIVDEQGDKVYWTNIDLCEAAKITLHYEGGKPTASIEKAQ